MDRNERTQEMTEQNPGYKSTDQINSVKYSTNIGTHCHYHCLTNKHLFSSAVISSTDKPVRTYITRVQWGKCIKKVEYSVFLFDHDLLKFSSQFLFFIFYFFLFFFF